MLINLSRDSSQEMPAVLFTVRARQFCIAHCSTAEAGLVKNLALRKCSVTDLFRFSKWVKTCESRKQKDSHPLVSFC